MKETQRLECREYSPMQSFLYPNFLLLVGVLILADGIVEALQDVYKSQLSRDREENRR